MMDRRSVLSRIVMLFACTTIILWVARPEPLHAASDRDAAIAQFRSELQALTTALKIPGAAYAIVEDGKPVATGAFGVAQEDRTTAFTTRTPLRIASTLR